MLVELMYGFCLGTLVQCLLKFSKRIFAVFCLVIFALLVLSLSIAPYEALLAAESHFWTRDFSAFMLGCFVGNFFGDKLYDWLKR